MHADLVVIARRLTFIRETRGPNRGAWVQWLQRFTGGSPGDPWCADYASVVLDIGYFGWSPLTPTGSTVAMLAEARAQGLIVDTPKVGDLFFYVRPDGTPHHVGLVTRLTPRWGIAGNTSPDGLSDNGTGVFEHALVTTSRIVYVRTPD